MHETTVLFKKIFGETVIYGIGAIAPRLIIFVLNPLLVYYISSSDFAIFTQLYAFISYINILLSFGFETSYFRFSAEKGQEPTVFNTSFWVLCVTSLVFLLGGLFFNESIAEVTKYENSPEYIRWFAIIAALDNLCVIPFAWLRFHSKPVRYSMIRIASALFQFLMTAVLFIWVSRDFTTAIGLKSPVSFPFVANLAGSLLAFLLLFPVVRRVKFRFSMPLFKRMIRYSWPIAVAGLAFAVNENFDKAVQKYLIPDAEAGAYGGVYKLAVIMTLFVTAYRYGIEPFFFKQMNEKNAPQTYATVTEYFTFFIAVAGLGVIANVSWLKLLFLPNSGYWIAIDIIPILVLANLFYGVYYNFSTWYKVIDRTGVGTIISWIGAFVNIGINLVALLYYKSFIGSAWATFGAYLLMTLISYFWGQRCYPIPYRIKKMAFFVLLLFVFSLIIVHWDYNFILGNALLIVFTLVLIYSERRRLVGLNIPLLSKILSRL